MPKSTSESIATPGATIRRTAPTAMRVVRWHVRPGDYVLDGEPVGEYRTPAGEVAEMRAKGWAGRVKRRASDKRAIPEGALVIEVESLAEVEVRAPESLTILESPQAGERVRRHAPALTYESDDAGREVTIRSKIDGVITWAARADEHGRGAHLYTVATVEPGKQRQALEADYCRGLRRSAGAFARAVDEAEVEAEGLRLVLGSVNDWVHGGARRHEAARAQLENLRERGEATQSIQAAEVRRLFTGRAPFPGWDADEHERILNEILDGLHEVRRRRDTVARKLRRHLKLGPGTGGGRRRYEPEALEALASFRELHGRWPKARECGPANGTPSARWLIERFGSLAFAIEAAAQLE